MNNAQRLHEAGYRPLVCVVPPGAPLSSSTRLDPNSLGKVPGKRGAGGWHGYDFVRVPEPSPDECALWDTWGANVGILGREYPGLDIDSGHPALTEAVLQLALEELGQAPVRLSAGHRRLLMYRADEPGTIGRMGLKLLTRAGESHIVELLGDGRQYLIAGAHPSGSQYRWQNLAGLWEHEPAELAYISRPRAVAFFEKLEARLREKAPSLTIEAQGYSSSASSSVTVAQADLAAPSDGELAALVRGLPNTNEHFPSRQDYVSVGHAIKAAASDEALGLELFLEWALRWEGNDRSPNGNDGEGVRADWERMRPPFRVGWGWLLDAAARCGAAVPLRAQYEFEALPVEETKPVEEVPAARPLVVTFRELEQNPELLRPPERVGPHLSWKGRLTQLWAAPKTGKSTVATAEAAAVTKAGREVLWLSFEENPGDYVRRAHRHFAIMTRLLAPAERPKKFSELADIVRAVRPALLVVDSLSSAIPYLFGKAPETFESSEWFDLMGRFRALGEAAGGGVLVLHHSVRTGNRYAGSFGIGGATDQNVELARRPEGSTSLQYQGRWTEDTVPLVFDLETETIRYSTTEELNHALDDAIVTHVRAGARSASEIATLMKKRRAFIQGRVRFLLGRGDLQRNGPHLEAAREEFTVGGK